MGASIQSIEVLLKIVELQPIRNEINDHLRCFRTLFAQMRVSYGFKNFLTFSLVW